jgi:hypothetical protein
MEQVAKKQRKLHPAQKIIGRFCISKDYSGSEWAREMKFAKRLLSEFPEVEFWEMVSPLPWQTKTTSLICYFRDDAKRHLKEEYSNWKKHLSSSRENPYYQQVVASPLPFIPQKIKTIGDFLRLKKN